MSDSPDTNGMTLPRDVAREKAAAIREQHRRLERRRRLLIGGGIVVVIAAIVAIVSASILGTIRPDVPGPLNMSSDGITIGADLTAVRTPAIAPTSTPVPNAATPAAPDVIDVRVYVDYACADCGAFQAANADQLQTWVSSGAATLEVHPIALLDSKSQDYSSRAANAAACVANYDPDHFFAFNAALLDNVPADGAGGPSGDDLVTIAEDAGVVAVSAVKDCVLTSHFSKWVTDATARAVAGPLPGTELPSVQTAPAILVDGLSFTGPYDDATAFSQFVVQAAGASFAETSTSTPTPTATPTPTPTPTDTPTKTAKP